MVMLPDQQRKYGSAMKVVAALPILVVLAVVVAFVVHLEWSALAGSQQAVPTAAATLTGDQSGESPDATLTYPGSTDIKRQSGTLASLAGSNPFSSGMVAQLADAAKGYSSAPIFGTQFDTGDGPATVLQWFDGSLRARGWCAPASVNLNTAIHVYVNPPLDAYAVIAMPAQSLTSGQTGSSVATWYLRFPTSGAVPSC